MSADAPADAPAPAATTATPPPTRPSTAPSVGAAAEAPDAAPARRRFRPPTARFRTEERDWLRRRLSILTAQILAWTVGLLPWRLRFWVGDRIGDVWRLGAPTYRANVRDNLRQAFGASAAAPDLDPAADPVHAHDPGHARAADHDPALGLDHDPTYERDPAVDLDALVRGAFRINGRNFTDLFRMPHWSPRDFDRMVRAEAGWGVFDEAIGRGKGVIVVTAHLGAFDVVGHAIGARGIPLTALTGRTTTRFIFDAVNYLRRGHNVSTVEATPAGVRQVIRALRRGEAAGFLADYDFFRNGLPVSFFGRETTLPPGPVRIARDTGALIVGAFARRTGEGYALSFAGPLEIPRSRDLDADLAAGMDRLVALLEHAISAMPEQWVILQRVWPDAPGPAVRVFPEGSPLESDLLRRVDELLPPRT